ncbi:chromosomal replication initiator protein DnaA [Paroceanicella profunda]|uniref:Chromosomal replication initiator protein DnaA n=1 Tax=Paroceanicella profunda TaxID=2579971 RepID=A0A5B8G0G8_9RHOB|nr:chromosomal replication initiator protein DnaA [Paroceanicella profunda]QDL93514.1 chromosomal replication initiator protein DnaA [Paroceanicella profunda]
MEQEATVWSRICGPLEAAIGRDAFTAWIAPLRFRSAENGVAQFGVPTTFFGNWVERNYRDIIVGLMTSEGVPVDRLSFDIIGNARPAPVPAALSNGYGAPAPQPQPTPVQRHAPALSRAPEQAAPPPAAAAAPEPELPGSPLDPRYNFDNFVVGKPNELAHAAARRVAEGGPVSFNPLFLYGGVGLGKTHLMHAIALEYQRQFPGKKVLYLSAEHFMYKFVQSLRFKDTLSFKQIFRSVDVLMVDDVQFISGKGSTQEEFFHTFNALVEQRKQVVISADRAPGEIDGLEDRIRSRLQWGLVVDVHPTDYELRLGILQSKAETHFAAQPDVQLASGVIEFLAHRISSNVRILEGALTRLFAFAGLVGRRIDLDMVQECLADTLRASDRKVTIDEIIRKVAEHYNLKINDLLSARRARSVARPRQIAMFLAKSLTSKSLPEIGRRFGGRDHTTVIHALRKIEELRQTDSGLAEDIELLRRMLEA